MYMNTEKLVNLFIDKMREQGWAENATNMAVRCLTNAINEIQEQESAQRTPPEPTESSSVS